MKELIKTLLDSMAAHDASMLPMAERYSATENGIPAAVRHMTCWRTITGINCVAHQVIDHVAGQFVVVAQVDEGGMPMLMSARAKVEQNKITELEVYLLRSRAESGFWYAPQDLTNLPSGWDTPIPEGGRATREELTALAKSIFAPPGDKPYFCAENTFGMENGGPVYEHIDYMTAVAPEGAPPIDTSMVPESGRMAMAMPMLFPGPVDPNSRVLAVDEEQGIAVAFGMVDGFISPYVVSDETSSCFVPEAMAENHRKTLTPERTAGKSLVNEMRATAMTTTLVRYHSGKVCGYHQIIVLSNYGSKSPWN